MTLRKSSKTLPPGRQLGSSGTDWTVERVRPFIGQDVRLSFKGSCGDARTIVGALIGVGGRERGGVVAPDVCLRVRSGDIVILGIVRILNITSVMETVHVWDNNPMDLAEIGYGAFRTRWGGPYWFELTDDAKEAYLAFSEAVRDAVHMGR